MTTDTARFRGLFSARAIDVLNDAALAGGFPNTWRGWLSHVVASERDFWRRARTRTVQFMAGGASLLWGISLVFERETGFMNPGFTMMRDQMSAFAWAFVFIVHTVLVLIVRWWPTPLPRLQWLTSFYGFVIWTYYVLSTWWSSERYVIGTSFEIMGVLMLGWSLRRAGRDLKQLGERDDDAR